MPESSRPSDIFPQRLREARELRDLNQEGLARLAKLQPSAVSHFETGARKPSFDNLKRLADALDVTTDYLLGRVDDPTGLAGADRMHRHVSKLKGSDRKFAEDVIEMLAERAKGRGQKRSSSMAGKGKNELAVLHAERLIQEHKIDTLPVNPIAIAQQLGILVQAKTASDGVSGMLIRLGNDFAIGYATHIGNEGFKRFCIGHELGHYCLPGHIDAVLAHGDIHESHAGFVSDDPYEREADHFAAGLLMPDPLYSRELLRHGDGLQAVEALAGRCVVSLTASALRYVEKASVPVAMVVSIGPRIDYCFMSKALQDFDDLTWPRKGQILPAGTATDRFNGDPANVRTSQRTEAETELRDWFGGPRSIPATEEVVGLGSYGKTLTILSSNVFADEADEDEDLEERWRVGFRRR